MIILSKSKIFLIGCLIFITGIGLASFLPVKILQIDLLWFGIFISCAALTIIFWQFIFSVKTGLRPVFMFLFLAILFLAIWRYGLSLPVNTPDKIWFYNQQSIVVRGYIDAEPDIRQTNQKLLIAAKSILLKNRTETVNDLFPRKVTGKVLITTNLYPEYNYGDELEITCELEQPEKFNDFAYDRYLARYNIYSVCYYPAVLYFNSGQGNWLYKNIYNFKKKLVNIIDSGIIEPESTLAGPIILGGQKGVADDLRQSFQRLGLTHIMAVSGFNISIVSAVIMSFLLGLGLARRRAFYLAAAFLLVYIILVGLPASAMRAGLMGFLVLWALHLGRLNKMTNSLVLTAALLLLFNPKLLRDDIGFQLSFLAILGLTYAYPIIEFLLDKISLPEFKGLRSIFSMTLAAQVFTLPVTVYNFSQISLIAPLANLAILWTLPILTIAILISLGLSFIIPQLAILFFLPAWLILKYIITAVNLLVKIPYGYLEIDYLWPGWVALYFLAAILIIASLRKKFAEKL